MLIALINRTQWPLRIAYPLTAKHGAFLPPIPYITKERHAKHQPFNNNTINTPMADPVTAGDTSPAWDPSSRTPGRDIWRDANESLEKQDSTAVATPHNKWRLNPNIGDKEIIVDIKGMKTPVRVKVKGDGKITAVKTSINYAPQIVSLKHPTLRDHNRWLVIEGEHAGKWVRRVSYVQHGAKKDDPIVYTVAVVECREGAADYDTNERLQIAEKELALTYESPDSKKLHTKLREQLEGAK